MRFCLRNFRDSQFDIASKSADDRLSDTDPFSIMVAVSLQNESCPGGETLVNTVIVIPARLESTRLSRKLLLANTGQPLLQHTWEAARQSTLASRVMVATDHPEIARVVEAFGGEAVSTRTDHASGTDRLAEVAEQCPEFDLWVNVQGDEPEISPHDIDLVITLLRDDPAADMATLACPIRKTGLLNDPNCVKVVLDADGRAMYFSRSPIPWPRSGFSTALDDYPQTFLQHIGVYAYRRCTLLELTRTERSPAERAESLEQLRALHLRKTIRVGVVSRSAPGIDTQADYDAFVSRFSS